MTTTKDEPVKNKKPKKNKGTSIVETSLRYLDMLEFIPRDVTVSVKDIEQALERRGYSIDKRTIQRDLNKLAKSFNLRCSRLGKSMLWSFSDDAPVRFFPSMDEHTALSFQLMQSFLKPLMAPQTLDSMEPFFKKSAELLSQRTEVAARWQEKVHVMPLGLPRQAPVIDPDVQETIYQALLHENPLLILYLPRNAKKAKEYLISPLGLVVRDYVSYVVAAMHHDGSVRHLPLHRFKNVDWEGVSYIRPAGFNLAAYASDSFGFQMGESPTLDLVLWMDKDAAVSVAESPISKKQNLVEQADGGLLLSAIAPNTLELRRWIHSFGNQVEVLEPGYLRVEIAEKIAAMSDRYKPN